MKKYLLGFLLLVSIHVFGQESKVKFGIRAGGMSVKQKQSGFKNTSPSMTSYNFGVFAESAKINDNMVIQPSLLFTVKGGGKNKQTTGLQYEKATFSYIELPVNLLFELNKKIKVGAGPYAAYFVKGNIGGEAFKITSTSSLKKIDLGYNAVFQVDIASGFRLALNYGSSFPLKNTSMNKTIGISLSKSF
jgi:Outer membrane protein beta-barrel domain